MAEHLQAVWQQVDAFDWNSWTSDERHALHKALCRHGDEWDRVTSVVGSKPKNEVVLAAIKLMLEEPDFLQHCGPELQPRLRKFINQQRQQQQEARNRQQEQQLRLQRHESYSVEQPNGQRQQQQQHQHQQQSSIDLQVAESSNLASMQALQQQLEQWQQQLIQHEKMHPLPQLPQQQQQQQRPRGKRASGSPEPSLPDDELYDQIRPSKRHQLSPPDPLMIPASIQQQTGSLGAAAGPSPANLSPQAAAVLATHQQILAAAQQSQMQQQQHQLMLAAAQQQQHLRRQHLLQSMAGNMAGDARCMLSGTPTAEVATRLRLLQQQQQMDFTQPQHDQHDQQTLQLLQQTLTPAQMQPSMAAGFTAPGLKPAAAMQAQQKQQLLQTAGLLPASHMPAGASGSAAATAAQLAAAGTLGQDAALLLHAQSPVTPTAAAAEGHVISPTDLACLQAAAATATGLDPATLRVLASQNPNALVSLINSTAAGGPGVSRLPASAGLGQNRGAAAHLGHLVQQQQCRVSQSGNVSQGLINAAANLGVLLGSAAGAAISPRAAAASGPDLSHAQMLQAAQMQAYLQQQQQPASHAEQQGMFDAMVHQQQQVAQLQRQRLAQQMQQQQQPRPLLPAAAPALPASTAAGAEHMQLESLNPAMHALLQQQQLQQQRPAQQDVGQLLQNLAFPAAAAAAAPETNAALALLAAMGVAGPATPTAAAAAPTSPAAIAAAAAAGGWNAAAFAAVAGGAGAGGLGGPGLRQDLLNPHNATAHNLDTVPNYVGVLNPYLGDCSGLGQTLTGDSLSDSSPVGSDETITSESHELGGADSSEEKQPAEQQRRQRRKSSKSASESESEGSSES